MLLKKQIEIFLINWKEIYLDYLINNNKKLLNAFFNFLNQSVFVIRNQRKFKLIFFVKKLITF